MSVLFRTKSSDKKSKGFTLVELIVVIAVLGIVAAIAAPRFIGYRSLAIERVCHTNRNTVERLYDTFLLENEHQESRFNQFTIENFDEICPAGGVISYENGKVKCSLHEDISNDEDEPPSGEVPWL